MLIYVSDSDINCFNIKGDVINIGKNRYRYVKYINNILSSHADDIAIRHIYLNNFGNRFCAVSLLIEHASNALLLPVRRR